MSNRNHWDDRYGSAAFVYGTEPNDYLRDQAKRLPPRATVLSLGEGEGRNAVYLAGLGHRVTAVDASSVGLEKARKLAAERGVTIDTVAADLADYDLGEAKWDAIVSIWCHLPSTLRTTVHSRIARALRPGGLLILEHYHPKQLEYKTGGPPDPSMMTTLEELARDFPSFERLHELEGEREVQEGTLHHGKSYVTELVARKPA